MNVKSRVCRGVNFNEGSAVKSHVYRRRIVVKRLRKRMVVAGWIYDTGNADTAVILCC